MNAPLPDRERPPDVERPGEAAATPGRESDSPSGRIGDKSTAPAAHPHEAAP